MTALVKSGRTLPSSGSHAYAGPYTLYVRTDTTPLLPYSQWAPAGPGPDGTDSLWGSELGVEVTEEDLRLSIRGVPLIEQGVLGRCPIG